MGMWYIVRNLTGKNQEMENTIKRSTQFTRNKDFRRAMGITHIMVDNISERQSK